MEQKKLKAVFVNGSPRKRWNTFKMLESAMKGAQEAGAECEMVNLYDIDFKGCKSCFACIIWEAGSVLPESGKGMEHMASFDYAYKMAAVRDWLFKQSK